MEYFIMLQPWNEKVKDFSGIRRGKILSEMKLIKATDTR